MVKEAAKPKPVMPKEELEAQAQAEKEAAQEKQLKTVFGGAVFVWLQAAEQHNPLIAQTLRHMLVSPGRLDAIGCSVTSGTSVILACEMAILEQIFEDSTFSGSEEVNYFDLFFNVVHEKLCEDSDDLTLRKFLEFVFHSSDDFSRFVLELKKCLPKDFVMRCFFGTGFKHSGKKKSDSCLSLMSYLKSKNALL